MLRFLLVVWLTIFLANTVLAKKYFATNADQFVDYTKILAAGDTLEMSDGTYDLETYVSITTSGTPEKPIVIKAQSIGGVVFTGESFFYFKGRFSYHY